VSRRPPRGLGLALLLAAGLSPRPATALEPRFDHRDQWGLLAELDLARDSVVKDGLTNPSFRTALRLGWSLDVSGEGDELQLGASLRLGGLEDPEGTRILAAVDARYRAYFGLEEFKTFVEVGLWASLASPKSLGALVGVGLAYDPSRDWGLYVSAQFNGGYGQARVSSVGLNAGAQLRW
jgi:hypothetical protein